MSRLAVLIGLLLLPSACGAPVQPKVEDPQAGAPLSAGPGQPLPDLPVVEPPKPQPVYPEKSVQLSWKLELEALCSGDKPEIHVENFDMTGDGKPERICWRTMNKPPNGEYLDLVVVHEGARRQSGYFLLAAHAGVQNGVCPSEVYSITPEDWQDIEKREFVGVPPDWPKISLTVHNACDPVHLFWPQNAELYGDTEVLFYFARL